MIVGASCTAELIQDDPAGLAKALNLPIPVIPLELPSYQKKENWGASETFYQIVRHLTIQDTKTPVATHVSTRQEKLASGKKPSCNILGPTALGFRHRDDIKEVSKMITSLGIDINVIAPQSASPADITRIPQADFNVVLYPEVAQTTATWLSRMYGQPFTKVVPIGVNASIDFMRELAQLAGVEEEKVLKEIQSNSSWYARSVDSTYLTGKRVFIFGDATHVIAAARISRDEMGFQVVGMGTYSREFAKEVREAAKGYGLEALITEDYLEVEEKVAQLSPELVLGTQMERHISKRLGVPCAVISAPVHVQDFPARYAPQMGFEGANVIFDTWVHPLMMGLEEHLLMMFREDFEFNSNVPASHLGHVGGAHPASAQVTQSPAYFEVEVPVIHQEQHVTQESLSTTQQLTEALTNEPAVWTADAMKELGKIPFFVRGKARRNTEKFAQEKGMQQITLETLYDAKAYYSR
jgi:light-independent protochlorophyllide reductase subunit B